MNDDDDMSIDNSQQSITSAFGSHHKSQSSITSAFGNRQNQIIKLAKEFRTKHFDLSLHSNKEYVLWKKKSSNAFLEWWKQTSFDESILNKTQTKYNNSHWSNKKDKAASCWQEFAQIARMSDETPMIACKTCHKVQQHPSSANDDINVMNRHLKSAKHRLKVEKRNRTMSLDFQKIVESFENANVSLLSNACW